VARIAPLAGLTVPHFGQGKAMNVQARAMLTSSLSLTSRHEAKAAEGVNGSRATGKIHSLSTLEKYVSALAAAGQWARENADLRHLRDLTVELAREYLAERAAAGISQKQLDADRNAMAFVLGRGAVEREYAVVQPEVQSRAYTPEQVHAVMAHQDPRNALATELAWKAGLRAHELLTLRRADEAAPAAHRHWRTDLFAGRGGVRYVVTGKGGLSRQVQIPSALASRIEQARTGHTVTVTDRRTFYRSNYNLAGGNAWSKSFGAAAVRALGWSNGAHGLRHTYAQQRMVELQALGYEYRDAREVVSQELGHFRGEIVEVYLR